ncbi:MAG: dioxygenase [Burkholderiales bacterium]
MLPTLFISHGAPSLALEPGRTGPALQRIGQRWPHPKAILIVSPHWMTSGLRISARRQQQALHDFSGFGPELHCLDYPAPGTRRARAGRRATADVAPGRSGRHAG